MAFGTMAARPGELGLTPEVIGSPMQAGSFSLKEPARLGEPVTLGGSMSSPGRAAMVPNAIFFL